MVSATDRQELLKYLVAPNGEGWQWAATWTREESGGERHSIEFYRTIPPAKTPEDRVTIEFTPSPYNHLPYEVYLDGKRTNERFKSHNSAYIFRLGLMATLKEDQQ